MKPSRSAVFKRNLLACSACALMLSGCSWLESWPYANSDAGSAEQQQASVVQNGSGTWVNETVATDSKAASPLFDETAQTVALHNNAPQPQNMSMEMNSASMMQPRGVGIDAASANRLAELEIEIQNLRKEINMIMPALTKLAQAQGSLTEVVANIEPAAGGRVSNVSSAMSAGYDESDIPKDVTWYEIQAMQQQAAQTAPQPLQGSAQVPSNTAQNQVVKPRVPATPAPQENLTKVAPPQTAYVEPNSQAAAYLKSQGVSVQAHNELQKGIEQETKMNTPMQVASYQAPASTVTTPSVTPNAVASLANYNQFVRGIRFGEHHDKTRMVLDSNQDVAFRYDVDPSGQIVVIDMPATGWKGAAQMAINAPLVASYNIEPLPEGGSRLVLSMREPVKILWAQALRPSGTQGHRIVFDIAPI